MAVDAMFTFSAAYRPKVIALLVIVVALADLSTVAPSLVFSGHDFLEIVILSLRGLVDAFLCVIGTALFRLRNWARVAMLCIGWIIVVSITVPSAVLLVALSPTIAFPNSISQIFGMAVSFCVFVVFPMGTVIVLHSADVRAAFKSPVDTSLSRITS